MASSMEEIIESLNLNEELDTLMEFNLGNEDYKYISELLDKNPISGDDVLLFQDLSPKNELEDLLDGLTDDQLSDVNLLCDEYMLDEDLLNSLEEQVTDVDEVDMYTKLRLADDIVTTEEITKVKEIDHDYLRPTGNIEDSQQRIVQFTHSLEDVPNRLERYMILDLASISQEAQNEISQVLLRTKYDNVAYNYKLFDSKSMVRWAIDPPYFMKLLQRRMEVLRLKCRMVVKPPKKNWFYSIFKSLQRLTVNFCGVYKGIMAPIIAKGPDQSYILVLVYRETCLLAVTFVPISLENKSLRKIFSSMVGYSISINNILHPPNCTLYALVGFAMEKRYANAVELIGDQPLKNTNETVNCHRNSVYTSLGPCYYTVFDRSFYPCNDPVHFKKSRRGRYTIHDDDM